MTLAHIQSICLDMLSGFPSDALLRFVGNILTGSNLLIRDITPADPVLLSYRIGALLDGIRNICNIFVMFRGKHIWRLISHRLRLECAATVHTYMTHIIEVAHSLNKLNAVAWREACGLFRIPVDGGHDQYQSSEYIYALARAVPYDETLLPSDAIQSHEAIMYLPIFETLHHRMSLQQQIISHEKNLDVIKNVQEQERGVRSVAPELRISLEALHEQQTLLLRWMIYPCAATSETVQRRLAYLSSGCAAEAAAVCAIYKLSHEVIITRLCEAMKRTSAFEEDFGPVPAPAHAPASASASARLSQRESQRPPQPAHAPPGQRQRRPTGKVLRGA